MVGLSGEIVAHIVLRVNATSGISATTTTTKARKQARSCSTFFVGFLDVIAQLMLPNLLKWQCDRRFISGDRRDFIGNTHTDAHYLEMIL